MAVVICKAISFTGKKSSVGLGVILNVGDVARCRACLLVVRLEEGRMTCSGCHRWREVETKG